VPLRFSYHALVKGNITGENFRRQDKVHTILNALDLRELQRKSLAGV